MLTKLTVLASAATLAGTALALAHGDAAPQAVDTTGLPDLPEEMASENPWRDAPPDVMFKAVEIGAKGFNSNCARCHGLEAISGGLAPDLRFLEASEWGDEWYLERILNGYEQNGAVKMPPFDDILSQEAVWAIRTYIETRPDDQAVAARADEIKDLRDRLVAVKDDLAAATAFADELERAGGSFETLSGAPRAITVLDQAAFLLTQDSPNPSAAIETIGAVIRN